MLHLITTTELSVHHTHRTTPQNVLNIPHKTIYGIYNTVWKPPLGCTVILIIKDLFSIYDHEPD